MAKIKFSKKGSDTHRGVFTAPTTGYYTVSAEMTLAEKTGRVIDVPNPNRKWYQFWKPKMIWIDEYEVTSKSGNIEIVRLKEGQEIPCTLGLKLK